MGDWVKQGTRWVGKDKLSRLGKWEQVCRSVWQASDGELRERQRASRGQMENGKGP